jgi:hypothetical protein
MFTASVLVPLLYFMAHNRQLKNEVVRDDELNK